MKKFIKRFETQELMTICELDYILCKNFILSEFFFMIVFIKIVKYLLKLFLLIFKIDNIQNRFKEIDFLQISNCKPIYQGTN